MYTNMSSGDYLAVKKQRALLHPGRTVSQQPSHIGSGEYIVNKQYLMIQTGFQIDEDDEPIQIPDRFGIHMPENDLAWIRIRNRKGAVSKPYVWSLPTPPYRKNAGPPIAPHRYPLLTGTRPGVFI
jgi:hypothetical protein